MKPIIAIALVSGIAFADKYNAGSVCRSSVECNNNCLNSQWTIAKQNNDYELVCDPSLAGSTTYYTAQCKSLLFSDVLGIDTPKTTSACSAVGGQMCRLACVITGSSFTPSITEAAWKKACADAGTQTIAFKARKSKADADYFAECSRGTT